MKYNYFKFSKIKIIFACIIGIVLTISCIYFLTVKNKKDIRKNTVSAVKDNKQKIKDSNIKIKSNINVNVNEVNGQPIVDGNENHNLMQIKNGKRTVYLTFDDGPSPNNTPKILDTLKKENVKATFFIIGKNAEKNPQLLIRERDEGQEIALHSYCHVYSTIYTNPSSYLSDLEKCSQVISSSVGPNGYNSKLIRFPGGSPSVKKEFIREIGNHGYRYIDWNAEDGDAKSIKLLPVSSLLTWVKNTTKNENHAIILMHDAEAKTTTAEALPQIIEYLKSQGFTFETIP